MPRYAIGDIQGCWKTLQRLLERIDFDPRHDRLLLVGDLVNRGPDSLSVLRWAAGLDVTCVLGNHDLHLLAVAEGVRESKAKDTLDAVLKAKDRDELLNWLATRPLLHREQDPLLVVHAGLLPGWDEATAVRLARELHTALAEDRRATLASLEEEPAQRWEEELSGDRRLSTLAAVFTRLRVCTPDGRMDLAFKGTPQDAPKGSRPWFDLPGRRSAELTIACGHWAALGLHLLPNLLALDSGCVWGGTLTAVRLEDRAVFQEPCADDV